MKKLSGILILIITFLIFTSCATARLDYSSDDDAGFIAITGEEAEFNINGLFPEEIFIKTMTQTFNSYYSFQLYNGKIFYKGLNGNAPEDWTILKKHGLPGNILEPGFVNPERIIGISADANELAALSEDGFFYHIMMTPGFSFSTFNWTQKMGWPDKTDLVLSAELDNMRAWSLGRRGSEVLWYEDINGNQHHYGTMGIDNCCFLLEDGQEIRFSDPGLPSDFSHNFLGPERGQFVSENISASGSTVFLINAAGEMYTRLVDFDTIGSDPMFFKYTYDSSYKDDRPGSDYDTNFNFWALPSEDWRRQPEIVLSGKAVISDLITIAQNGKGNAARELRVAGRNTEGETGFYYKQIFDDEWVFKAAPLELNGHILSEKDSIERAALRGPTLDRDYEGRLWGQEGIVEDLVLSLKGFNILEGSCSLIAARGDEEIEILFHPVEMWYYMKRKSPGRDGTPKLFMLTIDIPQEKLEGLSPVFREDLEQYLSPYDLKTFAFTVEAMDGFVFVESNGADDAIKMMFTDNEYFMEMNPEIIRRYYLLSEDEHLIDFYSEDLLAENPSQPWKTNRGLLRDRIYRNSAYLDGIRRSVVEINDMNFSTGLSAMTYEGVAGILNFTGLYRIDYPKIYTMTMHSGNILKKINNTAELIKSSRNWIYDYIITHTENRIKFYEAALEGCGVQLMFYESPLGYLKAAGIDLKRYDYAAEGRDGRTFRFETSLMGKIPALIIMDEQKDEIYLIEFLEFEETISRYIEKDPSERKKLTLKAVLTEVTGDELQPATKVSFEFNGNIIEIENQF